MARRVVVLAILLMGVVAGTLPVMAAAQDAQEKIIPSETCRGLWIIPITFGDNPDPLRLVLDTGASSTSVDPDSIRRVFGKHVKIGRNVRLKDGQAGPLRIHKLKARVHQMDHLSRALGTEMDGILGFPTFRDFLLVLDYAALEVRIAEGALPDVDGETVFQDHGKVRPFLAIEIAGTRVPVLVDSGSAGGLTLRAADPLTWETAPRPLSGSVRYNEIRIKKGGRATDVLAYGPLTIERPTVDIIENGTRLSGQKILSRFEWTFDQRRRRIRMIPDSDEPIRMPPVRSLGLAFRPVEEGMEVVKVFPDTPGEEAGIRKGDIVVAIDGTPIHERGCISPSDSLQKTSGTLSIRRQGNLLQVEVQLRLIP